MSAKGKLIGLSLITLGAVVQTQFEGVSKAFSFVSGASGKIGGLASNEDPAVARLKAQVGSKLESLPLPSLPSINEGVSLTEIAPSTLPRGEVTIVPETKAAMTSFAFYEKEPNAVGLASRFQSNVLAFDNGHYQVADARMSVDGVEYNGVLTNTPCGHNRVVRYAWDCVPTTPE